MYTLECMCMWLCKEGGGGQGNENITLNKLVQKCQGLVLCSNRGREWPGDCECQLLCYVSRYVKAEFCVSIGKGVRPQRRPVDREYHTY